MGFVFHGTAPSAIQCLVVDKDIHHVADTGCMQGLIRTIHQTKAFDVNDPAMREIAVCPAQAALAIFLFSVRHTERDSVNIDMETEGTHQVMTTSMRNSIVLNKE